MKQILTSIGLVLVHLCAAQTNSPQLVFQGIDDHFFQYLYSDTEGHLFVIQKNDPGEDINVFKEDNVLWKKISSDNLLKYHEPREVYEFKNDANENGIYLNVVETSDPGEIDFYYFNSYDVLNDTKFKSGWIHLISETYFATDGIYENGNFIGSELINYTNNNTTEYPDLHLRYSVINQKVYDFAEIEVLPDEIYVIDENIEVIGKFPEDKYEILGVWQENDRSFVIVKKSDSRVKVYNDLGEIIINRAPGNSILDERVTVFSSEKYGYVGVNNKGIYNLSNLDLLLPAPQKNKIILSSNQKPYILSENLFRDSLLLYDENADLVHSFQKPALLGSMALDQIYPSMHFFNADQQLEFLFFNSEGVHLITEDNREAWTEPNLQAHFSKKPEFQIHIDLHVLAFDYEQAIYELPKINEGEEYDFIDDPEPIIPPIIDLSVAPQLRPNPFTAATSVQGLELPYIVNIFSIDGKLLYSRKVNTPEENVFKNISTWAQGIYYFQVEQLGRKTGIVGLKR